MVYMPYNIYKGDYMTEFKMIAYKKENGEVPVEEFLDSVNPKMRAKIFELRCKFGSDITRVLYFSIMRGK